MDDPQFSGNRAGAEAEKQKEVHLVLGGIPVEELGDYLNDLDLGPGSR
ncbi:MAG: hypothetical protein AB1331_00990 [Bacillota bacterium]